MALDHPGPCSEHASLPIHVLETVDMDGLTAHIGTGPIAPDHEYCINAA